MDTNPDGSVTETSKERRRRPGPKSIIGTGVGIVVLVLICWVGFHVWRAYDGLDGAKSNAEAAKSSILAGKPDAAKGQAQAAEADARRAMDESHSFTWRAIGTIPGLGGAVGSIQRISDVVHDLSADVLVPAVQTGQALSPSKIISPGGKIDLTPLRDAAPALEKLAVSAQQVADKAQEIPKSTSFGPVDNARVQLVNQTADLSKLLANSAIAANIGPAMLGEDGPRSYFIGFQTNAEARGTGGLVGGYGIVRASAGHVEVDKLARNTTIPFTGLQPIDLGPQYASLWASRFSPTTDLRDSNFSPHFPFAAKIWQSIWRQQSGETVDGAVATDPVALSYVLGAVGPVHLADGEEIRADNVVDLTMSSSYRRFANDTAARKQYLQDVASAVVAKMTGKIDSPKKLLEALGKSVSEGRIAVWSADPKIEAVLANTELGHTVPSDDAPYAAVVVNNQGGNKMDYYLSRQISYTAGKCDGPTRNSTVTVTLTNNAPPEVATYPEYVAGTVDRRNGPKGTDYPAVTLYATKGAKLTSVTVNGVPGLPVTGTELGRPIFTAPTTLPMGKTVTITFDMIEPTAAGAARVPVQPLVDHPKVDVNVPVCTR